MVHREARGGGQQAELAWREAGGPEVHLGIVALLVLRMLASPDRWLFGLLTLFAAVGALLASALQWQDGTDAISVFTRQAGLLSYD